MTRKEATIGVGVTFPLWLIIALAIRDWSAGMFLWPVVFLGGLAIVWLALVAFQKDPIGQIDLLRRRPAIYVEVDPDIKDAMDELARRHDRKLTGEVAFALKQY